MVDAQQVTVDGSLGGTCRRPFRALCCSQLDFGSQRLLVTVLGMGKCSRRQIDLNSATGME